MSPPRGSGSIHFLKGENGRGKTHSTLTGGRLLLHFNFESDNDHITILKYSYFRDSPVIYKLQFYWAVKSNRLSNNIFKQFGDAKPPLFNASAKIHCGTHTGHTAHMAKGGNIQ